MDRGGRYYIYIYMYMYIYICLHIYIYMYIKPCRGSLWFGARCCVFLGADMTVDMVVANNAHHGSYDAHACVVERRCQHHSPRMRIINVGP